MSWIKIIKYIDAGPALKKIYDRIKGPNNYIDNVFLAQSLRPRTLKGHIALYKNTIHNPNNSLPTWYLEAVGVYISHLNGCNYCKQHHGAGFQRLYPDSDRAPLYLEAVKAGTIDTFFEGKYLLGIDYAKQLTIAPGTITQTNIKDLRTGGFSDEEILELNQVIAYFNYGNRTSLGLGASLDNDILGTAPEEIKVTSDK